MQSINTRADLDAIAGTPRHAAYIAALAGTIYRLEKDDQNHTWVIHQDTTHIERLGYTLADFPQASPPDLPAYVDQSFLVPATVSMRQARLALAGAGLLSAVDAAVAAASQAVQIEWEYATSIERTWPTLAALQSALGLTDQQLDALFTTAAAL